MPRPPDLWINLHLRVHPGAHHIIDLAHSRFWQGYPRPATDPVALGLLLEALCADFLAGPEAAHPLAAARAARVAGAGGGVGDPPAEEAS